MSLEAKIELLTEAVTRLIDTINSQASIVAPTVQPAQVAQVKEPEVVQEVVQVAAPVAMPAPPTFVAPVPEAQPTGAPFTDGKGLIDYVMNAYKSMGAQKGAQIQNVLVQLGYQNINDVKPEHYGALHQGIEALKG